MRKGGKEGATGRARRPGTYARRARGCATVARRARREVGEPGGIPVARVERVVARLGAAVADDRHAVGRHTVPAALGLHALGAAAVIAAVTGPHVVADAARLLVGR